MKRKICACLFLVLILVVCVHIGCSIKRNIEYQNRKTTFHTTCTSEFERVFIEHGISVDSINIWGMNTNYGCIKIEVRLSEVGEEYQVIYTALREANSCASDLKVDDDYFFIENPDYDRDKFNGCNFLEVTYVVDHQIYGAYNKGGYQTLEIDNKIVWEEESEGHKALREEFGIPENEETTHDYSYFFTTRKRKDGKCAMSHCDRYAQDEKIYCGIHGCCIDTCNHSKDPAAHCCEIHSCAYDGCGMHRYNYANSRYCQVHNN